MKERSIFLIFYCCIALVILLIFGGKNISKETLISILIGVIAGQLIYEFIT